MMLFRFLRPVLGLSVLCAALAVRAQETPSAVVPATTDPASLETAMLQRTISLHLDQVSLRDALTAIAAASGTPIVFSDEQLPPDVHVSLITDRITVGDAIKAVLDGTPLTGKVLPSGRIAIGPRARASVSFQQQGTATISGLVTDSGTGAIITQAIVHVDGTQLTTRTNATGHYTFSGLAAGEYRVTARHVGFLSKTHVITLTDSGSKALDFLLNQPATTLNEVVTTALGDQRRYQVGNVISTINVDSIAPNAPVTSITDLITGRAPGVEVVESSGLVGGGEDIRIRGVSSLLLQSDPIIIVDGIRVDNTAGGNQIGTGYGINGGVGTPYRLNDLDINQIASIDILKGPAATTEYGTDGANGVIIITTKRGTSGKPQWSATAEQSASAVPVNYPDVTWNWGHTTDGRDQALTYPNGNGADCAIAINNMIPTLTSTVEGGYCVVDSTTSFNPLNHAATTIYGSGPSNEYDLSVGGGSDALRYFFAAGMSNATGVYKLPDVYRADAVVLGYPNSALQPNTLQQASIRANTTIKISPVADVQVSLTEMSTNAGQPGSTELFYGYTAARDDSVTDYGYSGPSTSPTSNAFEQASPLAGNVGKFATQGTTQWMGGGTVNWRPVSWANGSVTVGIDHETQQDADGIYAQAALLQSGLTDTAGGGQLEQQVAVQNEYTVTARSSATVTLWRNFHLITSLGGSYVDTRDEAIFSGAGGLPASDFTINGASYQYTSISQADVKSGGIYVEENLAYGRCYAPLGLRLDVASNYGQNVASTQLPNLQLTCLVLTGRTTLRLRGSLGISDQQPPFGANRATYNVESGQAVGDPSTSTVYTFANPGNQYVRPEHDQELEGGFDLGLWNERLHLEATIYDRSYHDLLWTENLGLEMQGAYTENVGNSRNEGLEGTLTMGLIRSRPLVLGLTVNGSVNHNKLLTLAPGLFSTQIANNQFFAAGYPLYGFWALPIAYADKSGSGELTSGDFTFTENATSHFVYAGSSSPVEAVSLAPTVGLWRNTVVINAMFDYEGDFKVASPCVNDFYYNGFCDKGGNGLAQPLWEQALQEVETISGNNGVAVDEYLEGAYTAFRELSVAISLPPRWARALRAHNASLVGAVRNLALWTRYPYGDPETSDTNVGGDGTSNPANGSYTVNNDIRRQGLGTVPLTRQWTIRLNAGF